MVLFSFPDRVDEVSARLVASGVVLLATATILSRQWWLLAPLVVGFLLRVANGPRLSPLALLVTRVIRPRLPIAERMVPGPPKRFAQGIGAAFSTTAVLLVLLGATGAAVAVLAALDDRRSPRGGVRTLPRVPCVRDADASRVGAGVSL